MTHTLEQKKTLLYVARHSIEYGLKHDAPLTVSPEDFPKELQQRRATFVTLKTGVALRGCIGTLVAILPLIKDVAEHAFAAAFRDPRFAPVTNAELEGLNISISVLTPPEPISFSSEADLIQKIRPGVDGLIFEAGPHRGTFLPSVWESVTSVHEFLEHLKLKAGLSQSYWSDQVRISRYTTEVISETL